MIRVKLAMATLFIFSFGLNAQKKGNKNKDFITPSILDNTELYTGFFNFNYHSQKDELLLSVDKLNQEFLYVNSLSQGIGSNDIGLDRGQLGNERIVYFTKTGNKLLLVQPNLKYRSTSDNPLEQRSIKEAFAKSVLYSFPIEEKINGSYIINLTSFLSLITID